MRGYELEGYFFPINYAKKQTIVVPSLSDTHTVNFGGISSLSLHRQQSRTHVLGVEVRKMGRWQTREWRQVYKFVPVNPEQRISVPEGDELCMGHVEGKS